MNNKLSLLVNFIGVDKMSGAIKNIIGLGRKGGRSMKEMRAETRKLERQLDGVRREIKGTSGNVTKLIYRERELERQIERTNKDIERQAEKLRMLGKARGLKKLGGEMASVGRSATLYMTTPLLAAGVASANMAKNFDASMSNIATLIDTSTESMDSMGSQVRNISKRVPVELAALPPALYDIRSAGIQASDAMAVLEGSARLAVAGLGTTQESADLVTSSINAFNLEGAEQQRIYDLLFKTVKNGKTNIAALSKGFGAVAGTISNAGVEIDEYLASVAALTTTGLPAAQAHTQLRAVIAGLTRDTAQSRAMFQKLSAKDMKDLIAQSGGLVPALNRIRDELGGNDAAMLKLFGSTEALNAAIGLTGNQAEAFNTTLTDMREGSNALAEAFAKQAGTDAAKQITNMNNLQDAAIKAGAALLPIMTNVMTVVADAASTFAELEPGTQTFILGALGIVAAAGPVIMLIGGMVSIFGVLTTAAATLGVGVGGLALVVLGIPIALAAAAALIYAYWDEIKGAFTAGWDWVKNLLGPAPAWMKGIGTAMMDGLLLAINPLALANKLIGVAKSGVAAFKDYLGIKSPSRVFMAMGQYTTEGLARGIEQGGRKPVGKMRKLAAGVTAAGAMSLTPLATSAAATGAGNNRPAASPSSATARPITVNIYQQPGEDMTELAKRIAKELKKMDRSDARGDYEDDY